MPRRKVREIELSESPENVTVKSDRPIAPPFAENKPIESLRIDAYKTKYVNLFNYVIFIMSNVIRCWGRVAVVTHGA